MAMTQLDTARTCGAVIVRSGEGQTLGWGLEAKSASLPEPNRPTCRSASTAMPMRVSSSSAVKTSPQGGHVSLNLAL
jgi:hypothetical protein